MTHELGYDLYKSGYRYSTTIKYFLTDKSENSFAAEFTEVCPESSRTYSRWVGG